MKMFFKRCKEFLDKVVKKHKELNNRYSEYSSALIIIGVIIFAITIITLSHLGGRTEKEDKVLKMTNTVAEEYYFNGEYEKALREYENLQLDEEWPIYEVERAKVYSTMGEVSKSNQILEDTLRKRSDIILREGIDKYREKDAELGSKVALTSFLNGSEKATEYCEYFLLENEDNEDLNKTMFTIALSRNEVDKSRQILEELNTSDKSSFETTEIANMYIALGDLDKGLETLKEAWYKDKDDIKIYDTIESLTESGNEEIINKLTSLATENPDEPSYGAWLLKYYTQEEVKSNRAEVLLSKYEGKDLGNFMTALISDRFFEKDTSYKTEDIIRDLSLQKDNTYYEEVILSRYYYNKEDYNSAYNHTLKSIILNKEYTTNYSRNLPEVLTKLSKKDKYYKLEPYYREALYKEPFNYNEIIRIGDFYKDMMNNNAKAEEYYKLALLINPNNSQVLYKIAIITYNEGDRQNAINLISKCIELSPKEVVYHRTLSKIYYEMGKNEEVIKEIRAGYKLDEDDPKTLNNAGCYYITLGNNIPRGVYNLKYAYEGIKGSTDADTKAIISENYEKAKELLNNQNTDVNPFSYTMFY